MFGYCALRRIFHVIEVGGRFHSVEYDREYSTPLEIAMVYSSVDINPSGSHYALAMPFTISIAVMRRLGC